MFNAKTIIREAKSTSQKLWALAIGMFALLVTHLYQFTLQVNSAVIKINWNLKCANETILTQRVAGGAEKIREKVKMYSCESPTKYAHTWNANTYICTHIPTKFSLHTCVCTYVCAYSVVVKCICK